VSVSRYAVSQFRQPRGLLGHVAGWIMATRASNRERNLWTLDILGIRPGQRILEIGFGPGYAIAQLLGRYPTAEVVGLDHSAPMFRQASRRNRKHLRAGRLILHCGDVREIRKLEGPFDRVYSSNVAQFWNDRVEVFRDIHALLAPGGRVATTYLPRHPGATDSDALRFGHKLVDDMREAGFGDATLVEGPRVPILTVSALAAR